MLQPKSVDAILASFKKTIVQLNDHAKTKFAFIDRSVVDMIETQKKIEDARFEAQRAQATAKKLEELITV